MKFLTLGFLCLLLLPAMAFSQSLLQAAQNGDTATATRLISSGANVNQIDSSGNTPLILASATGNLSMVSLLIQNNANVNQAANNGLTSLIVATESGYIDVVTILLNNGANASYQDAHRMRAFDYCVEAETIWAAPSSGPPAINFQAVFNKLSLSTH
jgi:ankyrin repeat protein